MLSMAYQTPTTHSLEPHTFGLSRLKNMKDALASTSAKFVTKALGIA
jgi:hypothetical protein